MPTVFINYRTGDGEKTALLIDEKLSEILGEKGRIFRATRSIPPGEDYEKVLLRNVRRASVVFAVIGPSWLGSPKLNDPDDWVVKELVEAHRLDIRIVPLLEGVGARRLYVADLPPALDWLAKANSERVNVETLKTDLTRIVAKLAECMPEFRAFTAVQAQPDPGAVSNSADSVYGPAVQGHSVSTGGISTVIHTNNGTANTGEGDSYNYGSPQFLGDRGTYIAGDNRGGVGDRFRGSRKSKKDKR
ncbi:toll/interleukin-1 receptor domain-containing protein [Nonomuraea longicatena]|uniref:TIR domain-containing protein n=1 Tax=Nonomuraea longicatena TaxID=83682 RepID=A0ABP3ZUI6_9ACTN